MRRPAQHEVRARLADLGAVEQHADHVHVRVLAALREAILGGHRTHGVAVQTLFDAVLKLVVSLIVLVVGLVLMPVRVAVRHCASGLDDLVVFASS
jgi:hypothetical protein